MLTNVRVWEATAGATAAIVIIGCGTNSAYPEVEHQVGSFLARTYVTEGTQSQTASPLLGNYGGATTLELSDSATAALGDIGVERLSSFLKLPQGWDGRAASPLNVQSFEGLSRFFADTRMRPQGMSVFMSPRGNVVVNWLDASQRLIELEFLSDRIEYFLEATDTEDSVPRGDIGTTQLVRLLSATA